jgi:hypothetical protein
MSTLIIVSDETNTIGAKAVAVAVVREAPTNTRIRLPSIIDQGDEPLTIFDWSDNVTSHTITLLAEDGQTIMKSPTLDLYSNPAHLGSVTLRRAADLNGWYVQ